MNTIVIYVQNSNINFSSDIVLQKLKPTKLPNWAQNLSALYIEHFYKKKLISDYETSLTSEYTYFIKVKTLLGFANMYLYFDDHALQKEFNVFNLSTIDYQLYTNYINHKIAYELVNLVVEVLINLILLSRLVLYQNYIKLFHSIYYLCLLILYLIILSVNTIWNKLLQWTTRDKFNE